MHHSLDAITIASPCHADWNGMQGNEQVRFCGDCKLNVYNLSGMTRTAAEALIQRTEGRLCVRYFQRSDGTIITQDCPVGLRALHRRKLSKFGTIAAMVSIITVAGAFCVTQAEETQSMPPRPEHHMVMGKVRANPTPATTPAIMGDMAAPPTVLQGGIKPPTTPPDKTPQTKKKSKRVQQPQPHPSVMGMMMPPKTPGPPTY